MCGIVGCIGDASAIEPVLEGLKRLEYRGYDSAGISYIDLKHKVHVIKKEGKLENLKQAVSEIKPNSHIAIGHTRWATHGAVNDLNAHPHANETFAIVHNGIIENAYEMKKELQAEGEKFNSETDTEVFLVLLTKLFRENSNVQESIRNTFQKIEGNSAVVVLHKDTDSLYAMKRSAPLVCGRMKAGTAGLYLSSDPYALVGFVDEIYFPEDEILCELSNKDKRINFFDMTGNISTKYMTQERSTELEVSTKGQFEHFMLKEIFEQPQLIKDVVDFYKNADGKTVLENIKNKKFSAINIIACGTAWHAGLTFKNELEKLLQVKVNVELASEFRYRDPYLNNDELCLLISQSGETADTIACAELCKEKGLTLYSIVNTEGSTIYRMCEENFLIRAGQEIGVASTKAFTLQVIVGFFMAHALAGNDPISLLEGELKILSERISEILGNSGEIKKIAQKIYSEKGFIFTGRNKYFPIALEGALKLKEIAYVHAEGYAAGELKHGPIALIDENMINISIIGPELLEKTVSNTEEVRARRGKVIVVGPQDSQKCKDIADYFYPLNFEGLPNLSAIYANVVMQLLSYYIAKEKGTDIDKPRNLAKSVTVE